MRPPSDDGGWGTHRVCQSFENRSVEWRRFASMTAHNSAEHGWKRAGLDHRCAEVGNVSDGEAIGREVTVRQRETAGRRRAGRGGLPATTGSESGGYGHERAGAGHGAAFVADNPAGPADNGAG